MRMVARTMAETALEAGVKVVTGDTRLSNGEPVTSCLLTLPAWASFAKASTWVSTKPTR